MNLNKEYSIIFVITFVFFMFYKPVICFLMFGTLALFYAIYSVLSLIHITKNGVENHGKIVSYESDNEGYKTPIIEFQISEGKNFKGKPLLHTSSDLDKFQSYQKNINKTIKVIYDPKDPEKFVLKNNSNYFGLIILIIVGFVFCSISIGNLLGYNDIF
ncbi:DUF3592 domain-containing protein [Flavobacterium sp. CLA17]|uniref:DUF3592 domain-containing protein n=1 Tax=Flavobacterium sp. CLA17 TaxID=2724135 RepID=UPI001491514F|nr:DUF3592 domain-containing protein [Flavobacterium sp. CLA17]QSB26137.1 DUF3592 domain-containing protein [Flavobacterium sp. CLA17]